MLKKRTFQICFLILLNTIVFSNFALSEEYADYSLSEYLEVDTSLSNKLYVLKQSSDYSLKNVKVDVSFFPRNDYRQSVISLDTSPESNKENGSLLFEWTNVKDEELHYNINSNVLLNHKFYKINEKVSFPIKEDISDYKDYLRETDTIDYLDPEIKELANNLLLGEDDLFIVTHKFAKWVNENIEYDLNTMTSSASQKASWVIDTKSGVCDELTNLFIAMCRSAGIPARFVTGLAYTTKKDFTERWSPHGWAEVYFPKYGWVPFDVTYGQMGYLDAGHIKLKDAVDANRSSTKFEWYGYNVNLKGGKSNLETQVIKVGKNVSPLLELDTKLLKTSTGFGSYNAIILNVTNDNDYYVPTQIFLSKTEEVEVFDNYRRFMILEPNSVGTITWTFKIDDNFNSNKYYTLPFLVETFRGSKQTVNLDSRSKEKYYSLSDIRALIPTKTETKRDVIKNVNLYCFLSQNSQQFKPGELIVDILKDIPNKKEENLMLDNDYNFSCVVYNNGNTKEVVDVCLRENCNNISLFIGEYKIINLLYNANRMGLSDLIFNAKNDNLNVFDQLTVNTRRLPKLNISKFEAPKEISFKDGFNVEFYIDILEFSEAYNVTIDLKSSSFTRKWFLEEMDENKGYSLEVGQSSLGNVESNINLHVTYNDMNGDKYSMTKNINVKVTDAGFSTKIMMFLNRTNLEMRNEMYILLIAALIAGVVIGLVMRRGSNKTKYESEIENVIEDELLAKEPEFESTVSTEIKEKYTVKRK